MHIFNCQKSLTTTKVNDIIKEFNLIVRIKAQVKFLGELPKWLRGRPAKALGRETGARVQIPHSPPKANCTHANFGKCAFLYIWDCFGIYINFNANVKKYCIIGLYKGSKNENFIVEL